jgi:hypothetical protein
MRWTPNLAGTNRHFPRFPGMRIREENCNMVLLTVVALVAVVIASGATLVGPNDNKPLRLADRTTAPEPTSAVAQPRSADQPIINVSDQPQVRIIGAPFVPNTNPRER